MAHPLKFAAILFAPAVAFVSPAAADTLTLCNESGQYMRAAASAKTFFDRSWGWTRIRPDQCRDVAGKVGGGYLYVYVELSNDPFDREGVPYRPKDVEWGEACVNPRANFDYLYNDRGCEEGMVLKDFFEVLVPSDAANYRLTLKASEDGILDLFK